MYKTMVFYLVPIFFAEKGYFSLIRPGLKIENLQYALGMGSLWWEDYTISNHLLSNLINRHRHFVLWTMILW